MKKIVVIIMSFLFSSLHASFPFSILSENWHQLSFEERRKEFCRVNQNPLSTCADRALAFKRLTHSEPIFWTFVAVRGAIAIIGDRATLKGYAITEERLETLCALKESQDDADAEFMHDFWNPDTTLVPKSLRDAATTKK